MADSCWSMAESNTRLWNTAALQSKVKYNKKKYIVIKKMKMTRDTFRNTGKSTSGFFRFFKKRSFFCRCWQEERRMMVIFPLMQEKVNLICSQSSLVSQILTLGAHLSRETFLQNMGRFPAPAPKISSPKSRRNVTRVALSSKPLWIALAPGLNPVLQEGKWEMGVGDGDDTDAKETESNDL